MAYSPTVPRRSNALEAQSATAPQNLARAEPISAPDVRAIFSALRDAIATGTSELDAVLREIAEAAQDLTLASGTAVAIQREGQVICVGRSGETAPGLGARLNIDSGISGECLRTGRTLRCDDTEKDYRTDPEVCRRMRLRSIAAVPLFGQHGTIGVLEAFSTRTCAFAEEHMDYLARLAELAEAGHSRQYSVSVPAKVEGSETRSRLVAFSNLLRQTRNSVAIHLRERAHTLKRGRYWAVAAGVLLLLSSVAAWREWRKPLGEINPRQQIVQEDKARTPRSASARGAGLGWKPSPTRPLNGSPEVRQTAEAEVPHVPSDTETFSASSTKTQDFAAADTVKRAVLTDSDSDAAEAPRLSASNLENPRIGTLISVPVILPKFGTPISQGISEGVIERQVTPVYPRQALPLRLEGPVVLDATVSENGQLEDVKAVSGHAILAHAALDAVRQWRYRPYLLNGKPIRMQIKITVNFKMPVN